MFFNISTGCAGRPYNYAEFICDSSSDLDNLPTNKEPNSVSVGSKALIIETNKTYILNSNGEWVLISSSGSDPTFSINGMIASDDEVKTILD